MEFVPHERLAGDSVAVGAGPLSAYQLMNDRRFPWLMLVPRRPAVREIHDLSAADRALLIEEIAAAGRVLQTATRAEKIHVAALGNIVPQLHVHVVARFADDPAWPGPVWGHGSPEPYEAAALAERVEELRRTLSASP